jgi:hypothetical protein
MKFNSKTESIEATMPFPCGNERCTSNINIPLTLILSGEGEVKCDDCGHVTSLKNLSKHKKV